jgi:RNA polymerase sigma factor (sigma-70 family)
MEEHINISESNLTPQMNSQLWTLFIEGDMTAFHNIYNTHYQMLYNYGKKYLKIPEIEDCIHDTFLNILNTKNKKAAVNNVKAYLFISFRNQIYKTKKSDKLVFNLVEGSIPQEENDRSKELILKEVKQLIEKLSPREREIVYLKYFQDFNNLEISDMLDIKYQTVRNILTGAIKKLRVLGEDYVQLLFLLFK